MTSNNMGIDFISNMFKDFEIHASILKANWSYYSKIKDKNSLEGLKTKEKIIEKLSTLEKLAFRMRRCF